MAEDLTKLTVKELRAVLVSLGMKEEDAENFETKRPLIATINTLRAKRTEAVVETKGQLKEDKKQYMSKKEQMREILMAQPKVRILVPCEGDEKPGVIKLVFNERTKRDEQVYVSGAYLPVQLNGFKWLVAKGVYQEVPQQVADTVSAAQNMTASAGKSHLIDRLDPATGKKVSEALA